MPIISCTKCQGKLRFPDDEAARRVKCPKCGHIFLSSDGGGPNQPPELPESARGSKPEVEHEKAPPRRRDQEDPPRSARQRDDDDDDRRRTRRRDDDEADEDRPRRSRLRRDDDGDEEEDQPKRSRSRRDDDDDEDEDDAPRRTRRREAEARSSRKPTLSTFEVQMNRAGLGAQLVTIAGWLQVGALGVVTLVFFLDWFGVKDGLSIFLAVGGLVGAASWITAATGLGIAIGGPRNRGALGLSIASTATAGVHLILLIVLAVSATRDDVFITGRKTLETNWTSFVTQGYILSHVTFRLVASEGNFKGEKMILPVLANLAEIARAVLILLYFRAIMLCAKDKSSARVAMKAVVAIAIAAGILIVLGLFAGGIFHALKPGPKEIGRGANSLITLNRVHQLVTFLGLMGIAVASTLVLKFLKGNIDYRR